MGELFSPRVDGIGLFGSGNVSFLERLEAIMVLIIRERERETLSALRSFTVTRATSSVSGLPLVTISGEMAMKSFYHRHSIAPLSAGLRMQGNGIVLRPFF